MEIRFHTNPDGTLHIADHGVTETEVEEALSRPLLQMAGRGDSTLLFGFTRAGRVLKVVFTNTRDGDGIFVITAFDVPPKQLRALRRRLKRKRP